MFRRNPATGVVSLLIHGSKEGVQAAKEQLELLDHVRAVLTSHSGTILTRFPSVVEREDV